MVCEEEVIRTHQKRTSHERDKIAYWHAVGESLREMARRLGRSSSSISDEIKRNKVDGRYHSIHAHQAAEERKQNSHKKYVLKTGPTLQSYVVGKLGLGWSPEQIAGRLRKEIRDGYDQRRNTSTTSPFTNMFMMSGRTGCMALLRQKEETVQLLTDQTHRAKRRWWQRSRTAVGA